MFYHVFQVLSAKKTDLNTLWQLLTNALETLRAPKNLVLVCLCVLFAPLNWAFESLKWQVLAQKVEPISFLKAYQGVLAGLAIGFVMPNNVGDAAGRIMSLREDHRYKSVGAAVLSNALQLFVTVLGGLLALMWFIGYENKFRTPIGWTAVVTLALSLVLGVILVLKKHQSFDFLQKFSWYKNIQKFIEVIDLYQRTDIVRALCFAIFRYIVFTFQFIFLLLAFNIQLPLATAIGCVTLVFLGKTLIPAFNFLSDLGVREFTSIYVFGMFGVAPAAIVVVTLSLWIINLLLPSLVGIAAFWRLK